MKNISLIFMRKAIAKQWKKILQRPATSLVLAVAVCTVVGFSVQTWRAEALLCGNGHIDAGEQCDDGNYRNEDGCSTSCKVEKGWNCRGKDSSACHKITCGDQMVDAPEQCDDGNSSPADGCSSECKVEKGWVCSKVEPTSCHQILCGDGNVDPGEQCDDRNVKDGDGCSSMCKIEKNWVCSGSPSVCGKKKGSVSMIFDGGNTIPLRLASLFGTSENEQPRSTLLASIPMFPFEIKIP